MIEPTFLICSERSGSNLIRAMADAHSQLYAPMPLNLGRDIWYGIHRYGDLSRDDNWAALVRDVVDRVNDYPADIGIELTEDELLHSVTDRRFGKIYEYVYAKGMREAGKSRLFLKENHVARYLGLFLDAFPSVKFVYQVRDPRDYLLSCRRVARTDPLYSSMTGAIQTWRQDQEDALNTLFTLGSARVFVQRYEDLVSDPERVLRAFCTFLDIPFEAEMLKFYERRPAQLAAQKRPEFWKNLDKPVLSDNVGKHRSGLTRIARGTLEHRLRGLMRQLGYVPDSKVAGRIGSLSIGLYEVYDKIGSRIRSRIQRRKRPRESFASERRDGGSHASGDSELRYPYLEGEPERGEVASEGVARPVGTPR